MRMIALSAACIAGLALASCGESETAKKQQAPEQQAPVDAGAVVVRVNGHEIGQKDLEIAQEDLQSEVVGMSDERRRKVLIDFLVDRQLILRGMMETDAAVTGGILTMMAM